MTGVPRIASWLLHTVPPHMIGGQYGTELDMVVLRNGLGMTASMDQRVVACETRAC